MTKSHSKSATFQNRRVLINTIGIALFGILIFSSCTKKRAEEKKTGPDYASASSFYTQYQQPEQVFTVDTPGTAPIIGKEGTILSGDASIFMYPSGQSITYPFTLKLVEV